MRVVFNAGLRTGQLFLQLPYPSQLTTTRGCPILATYLFLSLGWETTNPTLRSSIRSTNKFDPFIGETHQMSNDKEAAVCPLSSSGQVGQGFIPDICSVRIARGFNP